MTEKELYKIWEETPSDCDERMPDAGVLYSKARDIERAMNYCQDYGFQSWLISNSNF